MKDILNEGFAKLGIAPDAAAFDRFEAYFELLEEKNKVMNLTAISGSEDVARLHFLDCAALLAAVDVKDKVLVDVGTGAGFPGLVIKIAEPSVRLTLLDSLQKRVDFLSETCEQLGFSDVDCIHARAEEIPPERRAAFDIATSRAVARLDLLCELCLPYLKTGGLFAAMKGPDCAQEIQEAQNAMQLLGAQLESVYSYGIPGTDITHSVVLIRKVKPTHPMYPRKWAQIKKKTLGHLA